MTAIKLVHGTKDFHSGNAAVRKAFTAARRHLAETVEDAPSTPSPLLLEHAARCRRFLATLIAAEPEQ
jgi:hypothetical protein